MICVSLLQKDVDSLLKAISIYKTKADLIEIRLDSLNALDFSSLKILIESCSGIRTIITNRAEWEGGYFKDSEDKRIEFLCASIELGASFVDVEIKTHPNLRNRVLNTSRRSNTKVILSFHDFSHTPSIGKLRQILLWQRREGAHIGKIVTIANNIEDCADILSLYSLSHQLDFKLLAFCMGQIGKPTRVASLAVGAPWMYVSPQIGKETAPGQLSFDKAEEILKFFRD